LFSVSAVYSFLKYLRNTTNRQANKFEELQLRFGFDRLGAAYCVFWSSAKSQPLFGSRPILWEPLASTLKPVKTL